MKSVKYTASFILICFLSLGLYACGSDDGITYTSDPADLQTTWYACTFDGTDMSYLNITVQFSGASYVLDAPGTCTEQGTFTASTDTIVL